MTYKVCDLFGGIGGFRIGLKNSDLDTEVVNYIEKNEYAVKSYNEIFNEQHDTRDATEIDPKTLEDFDILAAGFPCQAFSVAGNRGGFDDTRGTLFFEIARIAEQKLPQILLLENVKGLLSHADGETFGTVLQTLDELGYDLQWQVLNSKYHGVPQNRERVFIIGHRRGEPRPEVFPIREPNQGAVREDGKEVVKPVMTPDFKSKNQNKKDRIGSSDGSMFTVDSTSQHGLYFNPQILDWHGHKNKPPKKRSDVSTLRANSHGHQPKIINHQLRPESRPSISEEGQSGGSGILFNEDYSYALSSSPHYIFDETYGFDDIKQYEDMTPALCSERFGLNITRLKNHRNRELRIYDTYTPTINKIQGGGQLPYLNVSKEETIRKLTPKECWRLQGFPDKAFEAAEKVNSDTQLYKQAGNSVTTNVVEHIGNRLAEELDNP